MQGGTDSILRNMYAWWHLLMDGFQSIAPCCIWETFCISDFLYILCLRNICNILYFRHFCVWKSVLIVEPTTNILYFSILYFNYFLFSVWKTLYFVFQTFYILCLRKVFLIVGPTTNFQLSDSSSGRYTHTDVWNQVWRYLSQNIFQSDDTFIFSYSVTCWNCRKNICFKYNTTAVTPFSRFFGHNIWTSTIHTYCLFLFYPWRLGISPDMFSWNESLLTFDWDLVRGGKIFPELDVGDSWPIVDTCHPNILSHPPYLCHHHHFQLPLQLCCVVVFFFFIYHYCLQICKCYWGGMMEGMRWAIRITDRCVTYRSPSRHPQPR